MVIFRFGQYSYLLLLWGAHQMAGITPPFTASHVSSIQTHTHTHVLLSDDSKSQQSNACNLVRTVKAALTHSKTHTHTHTYSTYIYSILYYRATLCVCLCIYSIYMQIVCSILHHTHTHTLSLFPGFPFGSVLVTYLSTTSSADSSYPLSSISISSQKRRATAPAAPLPPSPSSKRTSKHATCTLSLSLLEVSCLPVDLCSRVRLREILRKWRP